MGLIGRAIIRYRREGDYLLFNVVIFHPMEPGTRKDPVTGKKIPAHYLTKLEVKFNGKRVASFRMSGGVSKNPVFTFYLKPQKGKITLEYEDNKGNKWRAEKEVNP